MGAVTACDRAAHQVDTRAARGVSLVPLGDPPLPALLRDGDAVFFVGNSFFGWGGRQLPEWVASLGRAVTPPIRIEVGSNIIVGNTPLGGFLEHPTTRAALAERRYRVWVLQGEEFEAVDHKAEFHQAVRDFDRAIVSSGGRTVLFMTWDFRFRPFIDELAASYDEIGRELSIPVIPAGLVFHDSNVAPPQGRRPYWLTADLEHKDGGLHQNEHGTAANSYATFALLTGRNPHGQRFAAAGNTIDDATLRYLSDLAFAEVAPRLQALTVAPEPAAAGR
ncbi:MAG: hypothetical protein A2138_04980 [Deltaproteobacteria bacterium RBG_16_71_12]|nr:MAG: hypothetical protein A2138_04980 [Deltaproteobacteria bacterium RBG_16_71_12]